MSEQTEERDKVQAVGKDRSNAQTIAGIERALEVLTLFTADGVKDLGVTEIANELGISKAVVHRVLASFKVAGMVDLDEDTRRYSLGVRALQFGMAYLRRIDVLDLAREQLHRLVDRTGETATVSVLSGQRRVYVAQVTPPRDLRMEVRLGSSHPLHAGASSKALLAFMPDDFRSAYLARGDLEQLTDRTVTSVSQLREQLDQIRADGWCVSMGERQSGAGSVAAPVLDHTGAPVASISVCGPVERFTDEVEGCTEALMEATRELSHRLGHDVS